MTGTALTVLGWLCALALAEITLSCAYRIASARWRALPRWSPRVPDAGWLLPELCGCGCAVLLTLLGLLSPLTGAVVAVILFAAAVVPLARTMREAARLGKARYAGRRIASVLRLLAWTARSFLAEDLRALAGRRPEEEPPAATPPAAVPVAPPATSRLVPAAPAGGGKTAPQAPPPAPDSPPAAGGPLAAALSPGWAGLCAEIDGFEADTDEEVLGFFAGQLAGHMAHAWSVRNLADRMLHGVGLDPAFAQGVAEYADENADMTGGVTVLDRQFRMIYDTLRQWVDEHPMGMPHRAREFLQGGELPLPEAGDDGMAA